MKKKIKKILHKYLNLEVRRTKADTNIERLYNKYSSFSMIPKQNYIENLKLVLPYKHSTGDVIECGVWKGGMIAGMAELLGSSHHYHLFDSFEGLPLAKEIDGKTAIEWQSDTNSSNFFDNCRADEKQATQLLANIGVPFSIHKGWFNDTFLDFVPNNPIDILRLDADWYDSTILCLRNFFPYVRKGGIILIDDYYTWDGCSRAVHDYLSEEKSEARIYSGCGFAFLIKPN